MDAWSDLLHPQADDAPEAAPHRFDLALHERALIARVRSEMLGLVRSLARGEFDLALQFLRRDGDPAWTAARTTAVWPRRGRAPGTSRRCSSIQRETCCGRSTAASTCGVSGTPRVR